MQKLNIYDETTQAIIAMLENADIGKFEKPWFNIGIAPLNAISRKPYRPSHISFEDWKLRQVSELSYYYEAKAKEIERTNKRNKYLKILRKSLTEA